MPTVVINEQTYLFSSLYPVILYNPKEGTFWRQKRMKQLLPEEDGRIRFYSAERNRQVLVKASRLAWEIAHDKQIPINHVLYHRNLDETDYVLSNLACIHKSKHKQLIEAVDNINEHLKIKQHPDIPHYLVLQYRESGRTRHKVIQDVVEAKKEYNKLLIKFTKIVGKYCSTV